MPKPLKALAKAKATPDLFASSNAKGKAAGKAAPSRPSGGAEAGYTAHDIEVQRTRRDGRYKLHSITPEPLRQIAERWLGDDPQEGT